MRVRIIRYILAKLGYKINLETLIAAGTNQFAYLKLWPSNNDDDDKDNIIRVIIFAESEFALNSCLSLLKKLD